MARVIGVGAVLLALAAAVGWRVGSAHPTPAPCDDALKALRDEHPECTSRLTYDHGYVLRCIGGDIVISDVIASRDGNMSSFIFTNKRTMKQGICDCDRPLGSMACESLE